jgi:Tol biopolymer transport system component
MLMRPISRMASTTATCLLIGIGESFATVRPASAATPAFSAPELWTPAAISTEDFESSPAFSPDGRELYFLRADRDFDNYRLFTSRCTVSGWSLPAAVSFAAPKGAADADPFITADGKHLLFASTRGTADAPGDDFDIWQTDRLSDGSWGPPRQLPEPVNSPQNELLPRMMADGRIIFGSNRPGGLGRGDIYMATPGAAGWVIRNMASPVNTPGNELEAEISRDGNRLVVVAAREQLWHLYIYERVENDRWQARGQIAADDQVFQVGPLLSPRADRLLFAQASTGRSGEFFLVDFVQEPDLSWPPNCKPRAPG